MLVLDSLINWAGVVDELDFAKRLSAWSEHGFPELGDTSGILVSSTITQVHAVIQKGSSLILCHDIDDLAISLQGYKQDQKQCQYPFHFYR